MSRTVRLGLGISLALLGVVLVFSPTHVAAALGRPYETASQKINMRASWGGAVLGVGLLVAWLDALQPRRRFVLSALLWLMVGVGLARTVGFVLDGSPNALQWAWLLAEIAISAVCAALLFNDAKKLARTAS